MIRIVLAPGGDIVILHGWKRRLFALTPSTIILDRCIEDPMAVGNVESLPLLVGQEFATLTTFVASVS